MTSMILTSRKHQQSSNHMTNFTNSNLNFMTSHNIPNPNPNQPTFIRSSINSYNYSYITFRINSYTKTELQHLKKRLVTDLKRVRTLQQRICTDNKPYSRSIDVKRTMMMKKQCDGNRMTSVQTRKMIMRKCEQVLGKLMMHKNGWVFNTPVDAVALKLYDYHNIINKPMDLGTVKRKLGRNEYGSVSAFASDVRLTFRNAMVYNGKDSDVFVMAERLLLMFEGLLEAIHVKVEKPEVRVLKKREMTDEEKAELVESLGKLKLGADGVDQIMDIVKKGVLGLERFGGEVELDLTALDNDTLWALHGFVVRAREEVVGSLVSSVQGDHYAGNQVSGEEYVDIGEEMELTGFPSVEIVKDAVNISSSESSSDCDSPSSDYGSGDSCNEHD